MEQIHKWRVVLIMAHDGETYFEYNDLEQSILDQSKFENLSYIILYYNQKYDKISLKTVVEEPEKRYLQELPETADYAGSNFYESDTLIRFLKFVKSGEEEKEGVETVYHYLLITWGHGAGLMFFPSKDVKELTRDFGSIGESFQENSFGLAQMCSNISFKGDLQLMGVHSRFLTMNVSVVDNIQYFTATELNNIFKEGLGYVDVYFALNCFTQMLETGFELRNSVDMMVAPQTTMPLTGINYSEVFSTLEATPGISLAALAGIITGSFERKYNPEFVARFKTRYPAFDFSKVSFSCNFLGEYQLLIDSLNQLTDLIAPIYSNENLEPVKALIGEARALCGDLTPDNNYGIIDLNNFLIELQIKLPDPFNVQITAIKNQFESVRDRVRAGIKLPDTPAAVPGILSDNPLFLSFFAPANDGSDLINLLLKIYMNVDNEYSRNSKWAKFVYSFYFLT